MTDKKKNIPSKEELKKKLTPEQFYVTQEHGTERAFTGKYFDLKDNGTYHCVVCGTPLFSSDTKYDSGSGWPSFYKPVSEDAVREVEDHSHGMFRIEILCNNCNAHLGHVFPDGPRDKTGLRYCMNSAALDFNKEEEESDNS